ncbi:MAG TPA: HAD hydrolase-like protein [Pseudonocardiaceae bacterium]|jgi:phosphoglycolate phosphatase-like HAD superfamily hydrolase|nr:HAD hydrolase-like protein [Pseudonocardiaceae bacterium]
MVDVSADIVASLPETLILWDVDHTLIENGGVSKETYALAFELLVGHAPSVRPATDGRTDFQIMRELLVANSIDNTKYVDIAQFEGVLVEAMKRRVPQLPQRGHILPGVVEVLTALSEVPTVVQSVLTRFGSDDKVRSHLVDAARRKVMEKCGKMFDRSSTILVGDTPLDVKAAHDGGAKIIAVATGVHSASELVDAGADVVLDSLTDLGHFMVALVDLRTAVTSV